jgi:serine/threonine protein kinase
MIGQQIGRFVIRRKLAEGGMGAVYLATHERLERMTKVVKILLPLYARNPVLRDRFEREALAVSRLHHKHIITIDDYGQLPDGQLFLMMPFLEGRPLDVYLRERGKLTEHFALHILVQVCSALQHMHDAGIVHRDIKPSNIFIVPDEDNPYRVVLIDLGIAKSLTEREGVTHAGATIGTPAYMAVEQYEDAGSVTPLADLYAVAIVAWEMVTARLPWGMHSTHVLYKKQKDERPARPLEMSMAWFEILSAALSADLGDRHESMRALAVALASAVPPIPPHVPSGAEILAKMAKTFVQHAPLDAETMRNASNQERIGPIVWPHRETRVAPPAIASAPPPNLPGTRTDAPPHVASAASSGYVTPPLGPIPTTLSASNGVAIAQPAPRQRSRRLVPVFLSVGVVMAYAVTVRHEPPAGRPIEARSSGSSVVAAWDAAVPVDAAVLDAAPPDASYLNADASMQPTTKPAGDVRRSRTGQPAAAATIASPPRSVNKPREQRSEQHLGSDDTFNRNAAGGDE